jgi:hypothetical protein
MGEAAVDAEAVDTADVEWVWRSGVFWALPEMDRFRALLTATRTSEWLQEQVCGYKNKHVRRDVASVEKAVVPVLMKACPGASADAEPTRVLVLMRGHKMLMEVSALPWLLNYLEEELHSNGLELVLDSPTKKGGNDLVGLAQRLLGRATQTT